MRRLVDANVILRYLLGDVPAQAEKARAEIDRGVYLLDGALAEVVYVLGGIYEMPRGRIASLLTDLLDEVGSPNVAVGKRALAIFAKKSRLDFIDCYLAACQELGGDEVVTFDKDLIKYLNASASAKRR